MARYIKDLENGYDYSTFDVLLNAGFLENQKPLDADIAEFVDNNFSKLLDNTDSVDPAAATDYSFGDVNTYYKILDKNGVEMPNHYSGRYRTYEEASKMVDSLNKGGEYKPYTMVEVADCDHKIIRLADLKEVINDIDMGRITLAKGAEILNKVVVNYYKEKTKMSIITNNSIG